MANITLSKPTAKRPDELAYVPEDDGYTFPGFIQAVPQIHRDVRFTYRPCPIDARAAIMDEIRDKPASVQELVIARALAKLITSWDLGIPVNSNNVLRLKFRLFARFAGIVVYGSDASDVDPKWTEEDREVLTQSAIDALIEGKRPGDQLQQAMLGN